MFSVTRGHVLSHSPTSTGNFTDIINIQQLCLLSLDECKFRNPQSWQCNRTPKNICQTPKSKTVKGLSKHFMNSGFLALFCSVLESYRTAKLAVQKAPHSHTAGALCVGCSTERAALYLRVSGQQAEHSLHSDGDNACSFLLRLHAD